MDEPSAVADWTVAVVPVSAKSAAVTFCTALLKVTRQVRLSALVGEVAGDCRSMEATRGGALAAVTDTVAEAGVPRV